MNNKGFTLVELITTFAVASAIALVLFNVVLTIKNIYSRTNLKTTLLIDQANLSNLVNSKVIDNDIVEIDMCTFSTYCYKITYADGDTMNLIIKDKSVSFGNYIYKLENDILAGIVNNKDSILNIKIPIKNKQFENIDFGLNFVYLYNNGDIDLHGIPSNS